MQPIDYSHATGYWPDGWAGTDVRFSFTPPAGTKNVRVIFEKTGHIYNLLVFVTVNGTTVGEWLCTTALTSGRARKASPWM